MSSTNSTLHLHLPSRQYAELLAELDRFGLEVSLPPYTPPNKHEVEAHWKNLERILGTYVARYVRVWTHRDPEIHHIKKPGPWVPWLELRRPVVPHEHDKRIWGLGKDTT